MKTEDILKLKKFINDDSVNIFEDDSGNIIVKGTITIRSSNYDKVPVKIHKVIGNFEWYGGINDFYEKGSLTSMENFPDIVEGDVYIFKNPHLYSLNFCPKEIKGSLICDHCNINDISGIKETKIGGSFIASYNPISDVSVLENMFIGGNIELIETLWSAQNKSLKTLNDCSLIITSEHTSIF